MTTTTTAVAWTSIREDIASLHLAAESFEAMPSEHKAELLELMRLSTSRLTKQLGEMDRSICPAEPAPVAEAANSPDAETSVAATSSATSPSNASTSTMPPNPFSKNRSTKSSTTSSTSFSTAPSSPRAPLDESQKRNRRHRSKRTAPRGVAEVAVMTDSDRYEGTVINESDSGIGVTISLPDAPPIGNGQNIRIIRNRRLRLARVVRTTKDSTGRFEIGTKWV